MITKFKLYETVNQGELEIGDYIIAKIDDFGGNIEKIINNNVGVLISIIEEIDVTNEPFCVKYPDADFGNEILDGTGPIWWFGENEILYWSKNKEDLEEILATKKYNL